MSDHMAWIADHILWLLVGGWGLALVVLALASRSAWRWIRRRRVGEPARWAPLLGAALAGVAASGVLLVASSGLLAMGPGLARQRTMLGAPAPEVAFSSLPDGVAKSLADFRGRVVLVNVWATWCPPCRAEMPDLDRLQRDLAASGLIVLLLSDEDESTLVQFIEEHPTRAVHGRVDPLPWPETGRPTSFLVDREGVIRRIVQGSRSYEQYRRMTEPYL